MHEIFIQFLLSNTANYFLGGLAIFLTLMYVVEYKCQPKLMIPSRRVRRASIIARAINWGLFGAVFVSFSIITNGMGLSTWRAAARMALLFLVLAEIAYETGVIWGFRKEISKWKPNI